MAYAIARAVGHDQVETQCRSAGFDHVRVAEHFVEKQGETHRHNHAGSPRHSCSVRVEEASTPLIEDELDVFRLQFGKLFLIDLPRLEHLTHAIRNATCLRLQGIMEINKELLLLIE